MVSNSVSTHNHSKTLPWKKRIAYSGVIYLGFILLLLVVEVVTRLTLPHIASLDLFVNTPQQKAQVADPKQSAIFEGDPLLLWRLKPNLDRVVWDFTVVSTNAEHFRANYPLKSKSPGAIRIICLGDSVTFGYRVPPVWPERPTNYDPTWLPYPMLLEKHLRDANPGREIEVVAMAVPGYTSHQGLAWLKRDIDWLAPDILTVSFGWNDASFSDVPDRESMRVNWSAVLTRWMVDHSQAFAHATNWLRSRNSQAPARRKPVARVSEREYLDNMTQIASLARERNAKVIVIGAPYRDPVTNPAEAQIMTRYRSALRQTIQRMNIHFLEVRELTESAHPANEGWFGELIHPNHMGHRLITAELCQLLQSNSLPNGITVPQFIP